MTNYTKPKKSPYKVLFKPKGINCRWHHIVVFAYSGDAAIQIAKNILQNSKEINSMPKDISELQFLAACKKEAVILE